MGIRYIEPLSHAYRRMKAALFGPFDITKWFAVGFTAFLAGMGDCNGGNYGGRGGWGSGDQDIENILYFPRHAKEWLMEHPQWFFFIMLALVLILAIVLVVAWLSSRGAFMFLDNVVHDRREIKKPWYEFRNQGRSLFLWRLGFGLIVLLIVGGYAVNSYFGIVSVYERTGEPEALIGPFVIVILGLLGILLLVGFFDLLLIDFVVPIMYLRRANVLAAWRTFLPLFGENIFSFLGYAFFILGLKILVGIGLLLVCCFTCCIGLLLMIIPYVGSVVLLPVTYTFRGLGVEFLEQFGPEFAVFPRPQQAVEEPGFTTP
jgi:hypothetical protein